MRTNSDDEEGKDQGNQQSDVQSQEDRGGERHHPNNLVGRGGGEGDHENEQMKRCQPVAEDLALKAVWMFSDTFLTSLPLFLSWMIVKCL